MSNGSSRSVTRIQYAYAGFVLTVGLFALAATGADVDSAMPVWFDAGIVLGIAAYTSFASRYWKIRPIHPRAVRIYAKTVAMRTMLAVAPALAAIVLRTAGGHELGLAIGAAAAAVSLYAIRPTQADWRRHTTLWVEIGDQPLESVWGTADPNAIPPWEDPDGGHGHELFHTH